MKKVLSVLGLAFCSTFMATAETPLKSAEPKPEMQTSYTYYVVNRKTTVPARNSQEAAKLAAIMAPYGNVAYVNSYVCLTWWLNEYVDATVSNPVKWSYYYSPNGTVTTTAFYFLITCPYNPE